MANCVIIDIFEACATKVMEVLGKEVVETTDLVAHFIKL